MADLFPDLIESHKSPIQSHDLARMAAKLGKESAGLRSLNMYFQQSSKLCEYLAGSTAFVRSNFHIEKDDSSTLVLAMQKILSELLRFENQLMLILRGLNQDVIEPLDIFREHYDNNCKGFVEEAQAIFREVDEIRRKTLKDKEDYFASAVQLDRAQNALKRLADSPDPASQSAYLATQRILCLFS